MAPLVALLFVVKTIIRSVGPSHSAKVQQLPAEWQNNESIFALFSPPPPDRGFPRIARFWSRSNTSWIYFLTKNSPTPASYSFIFGLFKQTIQFLQQINEKNVHPVYGARIQTHDLLNMSHHRITTRPGFAPKNWICLEAELFNLNKTHTYSVIATD